VASDGFVGVVRYLVGSDQWRNAAAGREGGWFVVTKQHRQEALRKIP
jgi:hypothetical protein